MQITAAQKKAIQALPVNALIYVSFSILYNIYLQTHLQACVRVLVRSVLETFLLALLCAGEVSKTVVMSQTNVMKLTWNISLIGVINRTLFRERSGYASDVDNECN